MGIVKELIVDMELNDKQEFRIEYNQNKTIHLHLDDVRIELSKEEFSDFRDMILDGRSKLEEYK